MPAIFNKKTGINEYLLLIPVENHPQLYNVGIAEMYKKRKGCFSTAFSV